MGNKASIQQTVKAPIKQIRKDPSQDIAKKMNTMNLLAIQQQSKSNTMKNETEIPLVEKMSINTAKMLFRDAESKNVDELAKEYSLSKEFVQKITDAYKWPNTSIIQDKEKNPIDKKSFGRSK